MTTTEAPIFNEELVQAGGLEIQLRKGGSGDPLLVLHGELGVPGWLRAYEELAKHYTVIVPSLPGFGQSERPPWIMTVRDMAAWVTWFARDMGLTDPFNVVGFSVGGWVAAEIATANASIFKKMVLVGPAGLQPEDGQVFDYWLNSAQEAFERGFHDSGQATEYLQYWGHDWSPEEGEQIEINREMAARLIWKPYMRSHSLSALLLGVATPTQLIWGREDAIIPIDCCRLYQQAIPGATAAVMDDCGHLVEMEQPEEFVRQVRNFLS